EKVTVAFGEQRELGLVGRLGEQMVAILGDGNDDVRGELIFADIPGEEFRVHGYFLVRRREECGIDEARDPGGEEAGVGAGEVGEHDDGQVVIDVALDDAGKALPCASVPDHLVAIGRNNAPAEAVIGAIGLAIVEGKYGPYPVEAGLLQEAGSVEGFVP